MTRGSEREKVQPLILAGMILVVGLLSRKQRPDGSKIIVAKAEELTRGAL